METYRSLTIEEIRHLEQRGCAAEDWSAIEVAADFTPDHLYHVTFHGNIRLGVFDKSIEVSKGFARHSGIRNAILCDVSVGDNCLIENIGNFIRNYTIGEECCVIDAGTVETTEGATFGAGFTIAVLNEMGDGNILLFDRLDSQLAALMVKYEHDKPFTAALRNLVRRDIEASRRDRGTIGNRVRISHVTEIINTHIDDECEIVGANRLSDCTIRSLPDANVFVGSGVVCENTIVGSGSSVVNNVILSNCFVGEACVVADGFTASSCVFFANSHLACGEACAAFCGPFTASHHKSTLLIGGMYSFYNAGSATNFSNHAYKLGPMHHGLLERGSKTASGAYLFMPAHIGAFSVCFGKIMNHPDTRSLPFSYVMADDSGTAVVPGRNLVTVGLYRDIRKWPKRDLRPREARKSIVNMDWLNPYTMSGVADGKRLLEDLMAADSEPQERYLLQGMTIRAEALKRGIRRYDMALRMFMGEAVKKWGTERPLSVKGTGAWTDLAGCLLPESEEQQLVDDVTEGRIADIDALTRCLHDIHLNYDNYSRAWAYRLMLDYYRLDNLTEADARQILGDARSARREWYDEIMKDAGKEYELGDVNAEILRRFHDQIIQEKARLEDTDGPVPTNPL